MSNATAKAAKASQKWARISRLLCNTTQSPPACGELQEGGLVYNLQAPPHALVAHATEFVARHVALRRRFEARAERGDVTGYQHGIDVGVLNQKSMNDIGAGSANGDL